MTAPSSTWPIVSVIIPCFNAERLIGDAIRSALDQTYTNTEVIVIDDGSTDGSLDIIRSFGERVRWETGPNRGGNAARNRGLEISNGQFVQFLDADDKLLPSKITSGLRQLLRSDVDVCLVPFRIVHLDSHLTLSGFHELPAGDPLEWLLTADLRMSPLYRSAILSTVRGFDPSLPCCQEFDLNLRIALHGARYTCWGQIGYEVRRQPGSVSSDEIRLYRVMVKILNNIANHLDPLDSRTDARKKSLATRIAACGRWLLRFGDSQGGLEAFATAFAVHESGGLKDAYSTLALQLRRLMGPMLAERFLWRLRCLRNEGVNRLPRLPQQRAPLQR